MNRLTLLVLVGVALLLAGCGVIGGPQPTPTPMPTYTPWPTYTPLPTYTPFPSPTATFLPSPTPIPLESPTPEGGSPQAVAPTAASSTMQATLAFGANLRSGPGTTFDVIDALNAGELLQILGRDVSGGWVLVRTLAGQEGWVAVTQLTPPIDIPRIPLAPSIPTPAVTATPRATATQATASGAIRFNPAAGGAPQCQTFTWVAPARFGVDNPPAPYQPFDTANAGSIMRQRAFFLDRPEVPQFFNVYIQGNITPAGCTSDNTCSSVTMTMCATAAANAPVGGFEYEQNVQLRFGIQSYANFYEDFRVTIPTVFQVAAP